ncbi:MULTISPECIES: hypothetical protein [Sulfurisphaera]|uniref:Uncharacterized protein n=1 Tax=Sulfurisphaera ohwakuensis TaxID=69656 RepID=A0A650CIU6_SULOH|nr:MULTISPECIES: hypothetical protein [Sulfurisphaera]MBB5253477.1 hypothetical protein [Sulfurisphaera ohwakuensis]QGR17784.1 hypothetical protein D1869_11810 [Sulfurisphaera ohwakuensis]
MISQKVNIIEMLLLILLILLLLASLFNPLLLFPAIGLSMLQVGYNKGFLPIPLSLILLLILGLRGDYYSIAIMTILAFLLFMIISDKIKYYPFR